MNRMTIINKTLLINDANDSFAKLDPNTVLDAMHDAGYACDGRLLALNSYENRVYQLGIDDGLPLVVKFYRPNRWTDAQIIEEHTFVNELVKAEIPAVPALFNTARHTTTNIPRFSICGFS